LLVCACWIVFGVDLFVVNCVMFVVGVQIEGSSKVHHQNPATMAQLQMDIVGDNVLLELVTFYRGFLHLTVSYSFFVVDIRLGDFYKPPVDSHIIYYY
jgi:hypothetical protein